MRPSDSPTASLALGCVFLIAAACGGSGSSSGGKFTSVAAEGLSLELKPGGVAVFTAQGMGESSGTYTVDGQKIIVTMDGQTHTLIRNGNCLEDQLNVFGRLCIGGKTGEVMSAAPTASSDPAGPTGTWVATTAEGTFRLEFKPGNTLTMTASPTVGQPESVEGRFTVEGDEIHATVGQGEPLVLKYVNSAYESTSFGFPMKFVKQ